MSATIFQTVGQELLTRSSEKIMCVRPELKKAKRSLFGPVNHEMTQKFIEQELNKIKVRDSEKWNFDFVEERTLSSAGVFEWRPVTPQKNIRPIKRPPSQHFELMEELYANPEECLVRPKPLRQVEPKAEQKSNKSNHQTQITDFMRSIKRSSSEAMKKSDWNSERPSKIPRIADFTR